MATAYDSTSSSSSPHVCFANVTVHRMTVGGWRNLSCCRSPDKSGGLLLLLLLSESAICCLIKISRLGSLDARGDAA